jgi:hypothetical protein
MTAVGFVFVESVTLYPQFPLPYFHRLKHVLRFECDFDPFGKVSNSLFMDSFFFSFKGILPFEKLTASSE